jgi:hypothetical protein
MYFMVFEVLGFLSKGKLPRGELPREWRGLKRLSEKAEREKIQV